MKLKRVLAVTTVVLPNLVVGNPNDCYVMTGDDIGTGNGYSAAHWVTPTWWGETEAQYFGAEIEYTAANQGKWTTCGGGGWYLYDYGEGTSTAVYRTFQWVQYDIAWSRVNNCSGLVQ